MKRLALAFMDTEITVPVPHLAAVVFGCLLGAAQALNQTDLNLSAKWHAYLGVALAVAAYLGVRPLVGTQFRDALHLPSVVTQAVTILVAAATVVIGAGILAVGSPALVILSTATTVLLALGFGPVARSAIAAAAARRRAAQRGAATRAARRASK